MARNCSLLQVLFVGQVGAATLHDEGASVLDSAWAISRSRGVEGFLSHRERDCLGLFRGPEATVIKEIEQLLVDGYLRRIEVLDERFTLANVRTRDLLPEVAKVLSPDKAYAELAQLEPFLEFGVRMDRTTKSRIH